MYAFSYDALHIGRGFAASYGIMIVNPANNDAREQKSRQLPAFIFVEVISIIHPQVY